MMTISREIVNIFREKHEEFQSFYLFEFTRSQITESQKQLANGLLNQATAFMKEKQVPIEVGNLNLSKAELLQQCNKLMDKAKHMHGENHKSQ